MLYRYLIIFLVAISFFMIIVDSSHAFIWMVYHKSAFNGKVIEAETKEPIEGAVVVAVYNKATIGLGAGTLSSVINVREALTDKDGMFRIPSYTTMIQPFSWEISATFIIFKPGYGSFPNYRVKPPMELSNPAIEIFFSSNKEIGKEGELVEGEEWWKKYKVTFGIVELPKLKTREERRKAKPAPEGEKSDWKKQKQLIKLIREEWQYLTGKDPSKLYRWEDD